MPQPDNFESPINTAALRAFLQCILDGGSPNGTPPEAFGDYRDVVEILLLAHVHGGTPKVREVWKDLVRRHPELTHIVSTDPRAAEPKVEWTAEELLAAEFPPIKWIVPTLLSEGVAILAGRPKLGKSWLGLQLAHAVACGGNIFDQTVERGSVLYIALENSERRLQRRMRLQHWPASATATFYTALDPLDAGGLTVLQAAIEEGSYRFVVIDTLSRALSGRRNQNEMGEMTSLLSPLQRLALDKRASILLIDHHTKARGANPDPVDDILGSTGKGAAADCVMGLYRERGKKAAILRVVGRDLDEDQSLALTWDAQLCCWQRLRDEGEEPKETMQAQILAAIVQLGGQATKTQLAQALGKDKGNISREVDKLVDQRKLERGAKIGREQFYRLPGHPSREAGDHGTPGPGDCALDLRWNASRGSWQWEGETTPGAADPRQQASLMRMRRPSCA
jgi:hypothetical protein